MKRLVWIVAAFFAAANFVGCVKLESEEEQAALSARIETAVTAVPGVSSVEVNVSRAHSLSSLSIACWATSSAVSKKELQIVLEDVARAVYDSLDGVNKGLLTIVVSHGSEQVTNNNLGTGLGTIQELRKYFED